MSELSEIKKGLDDLKTIVVTHIAATNEYREHRDKLVDAHSKALWDHEGKPGLTTKVDRIIQAEEKKDWQRKALGTGFIALICERAAHIFK